jgi:hypothetical protein
MVALKPVSRATTLRKSKRQTLNCQRNRLFQPVVSIDCDPVNNQPMEERNGSVIVTLTHSEMLRLPHHAITTVKPVITG